MRWLICAITLVSMVSSCYSSRHGIVKSAGGGEQGAGNAVASVGGIPGGTYFMRVEREEYATVGVAAKPIEGGQVAEIESEQNSDDSHAQKQKEAEYEKKKSENDEDKYEGNNDIGQADSIKEEEYHTDVYLRWDIGEDSKGNSYVTVTIAEHIQTNYKGDAFYCDNATFNDITKRADGAGFIANTKQGHNGREATGIVELVEDKSGKKQLKVLLGLGMSLDTAFKETEENLIMYRTSDIYVGYPVSGSDTSVADIVPLFDEDCLSQSYGDGDDNVKVSEESVSAAAMPNTPPGEAKESKEEGAGTAQQNAE